MGTKRAPKPEPIPEPEGKLPTYKDFDNRLTLLDKTRGKPQHIGDSLAYVHDTLETTWLSARVIFGEKATPEVALAIYDRVNAERLRRVGEEESELKRRLEEEEDERSPTSR